MSDSPNTKSGFAIAHQPEYDALYAFDAENKVEPTLTIARRIAQKFDMGRNLEMVDEILYALNVVQEVSERRGKIVAQISQPPNALVKTMENLVDAAAEVHRLSDRACVEWFALTDAMQAARATIDKAKLST